MGPDQCEDCCCGGMMGPDQCENCCCGGIMGPDQCENCCYSCVCGSCGVAFCCRSTNKTRIQLLWVSLILSTAASCVILACVVYSPSNLSASPSDMRPITNNINFLFCEEVVVTSSGLPFDGYVMSAHALSERTVTNFTQTTAVFIEQGSFNYLSMYLLNYSRIELRFNSQIAMTFFLIKGTSQFRKWQHDEDCADCYIDKIALQPKNLSLFAFSVTADDDYFFVYRAAYLEQTWVDISLNINRSVFVLDHTPRACLLQQECDLLLSKPDDVVVISLQPGNLGEFKHANLTTKCAPRIWAYLVLHGLPVLLIGVCLSVIIQRCCSSPSGTPDERSPLLYSAGLPPDYHTITASPPKYEDIMHDDSPPPYAQVVRDLGTYGIQADGAQTHSHGMQTENSHRHSYGIQADSAVRPHVHLPVGTTPHGHAGIQSGLQSTLAAMSGYHRGPASSHRPCDNNISRATHDRVRNSL
ncbi:uncharacterized protein LOC127864231 [Dreissena polymorpha]|uniref:E3 ubiquitin-protein ligase APD1-4 middle domain-containing protein n=1 Tax=Dreissena polymorpha TaxID=45954 RepID=A0A9D4NF64_DREPO|nr:uncharacterized protein LOC127864231 [Dreissena polymorpha]XP_052259882.1 uncharacterized protein LOC127864231 [Dreissena polymorpha]XP_052259883.1 uncharacterized protein LOC127864231 [Dreissena polymorpha]XP_052259884.1 uncharacterized protein LOC127864231 [Dreissena polymorpha]KAH3895357.1 hypothetical protein DPMN_019520 [Dreissena polymorpha]